MTLRTLNYGNFGIFLIVGNAGFCPSTVPTAEDYDATLKGSNFGASHTLIEDLLLTLIEN